MTVVRAPDIVDLAFTQKVKIMETKFKKFSDMLRGVERVSIEKWELSYNGVLVANVYAPDADSGECCYSVALPGNDYDIVSFNSFMAAMSFVFKTYFVVSKIIDMREFALSAIENCRVRIQYFRRDKENERWIIFNKHDKTPSIVYALSCAGVSAPMWEPMHLGVISSSIMMFKEEWEALHKLENIADHFKIAKGSACKMSEAIAETCDHFGYLVMDCNTDLIKLNKQGFIR